MKHDGLEFYNIAELRNVDKVDGLRLQRVPEEVRVQLNEGTASTMLSPAGGEIRFRIAEGKESVTIRLSAESPTMVYAYHGPFQGGFWELDSVPKDIKVATPKRLAQFTREDFPRIDYDSGLVRLCFGGAYPEPVFYHGHSEGACLPRSGDVPKKRYLAYGSSITHGIDLAGAAISYTAHVAWRLGMELRNLGASGCCLCEKAMADYLAEQPCDIVTLELSVNMLGAGISAEEFRKRANYLVERVADADPKRPVVCITIFPFYQDINPKLREPKQLSTPTEYREILRDIVRTLARPNLTLVEGSELLPDIGMLSADLIHPAARGMVNIGEELARRLSKIVYPAGTTRSLGEETE